MTQLKEQKKQLAKERTAAVGKIGSLEMERHSLLTMDKMVTRAVGNELVKFVNCKLASAKAEHEKEEKVRLAFTQITTLQTAEARQSASSARPRRRAEAENWARAAGVGGREAAVESRASERGAVA